MTTPTTTTERPRVRWGAIIWGLVQVAVAILLLLIATDPGLRRIVVDGALSLQPAGFAAIAIAALGTVALLIGLVRVLHRR
ncbi:MULTISPECIES: hypothetical protein [unclassified Rathayibacter]|uniref:hypothetical protein n=1 Tax=unclassified Rathayibacter TaxID=2609250 RepID=UPI00188DC59E|nr:MULTISPECIES: hypothetical protein [unclassified Rathayibacter]MBF4461018.1 hypothetical protein [Rathayibacter sp. VKM Ac-2879]MBF4502429.1 hypothetical protein [Rathayibacter sp. VKM Ac-2878]